MFILMKKGSITGQEMLGQPYKTGKLVNEPMVHSAIQVIHQKKKYLCFRNMKYEAIEVNILGTDRRQCCEGPLLNSYPWIIFLLSS